MPSSASSPNSFTVTRQGTEIQVGPVVAASAAAVADSAALQFKATLFDVAGVRLLAQSVFFEFSGGGQVITRPVQTNLVGEAIVTIPALPPGAYTLRVMFIGTDSYLPAIVTFGVKQTQVISFAPLPNKRLGDPPFSLSATASSGLVVSFASTTPAACAVTGNTVTLLTISQCSILASQAGNSAYSAAPNVVRTFTVDAAAVQSQTIGFAPLPNKRLSDPPFSLSATASSGLAVSFASTTSAVCRVTGNTVTLLAVGQCSILASQAGDSAYSAAPNVVRTFTVDAAARQSQTINFGPLPDKRPSDPPFSLSATATSGLVVSFASTTPAVCAVTGETVTLLAVGQCSILASQAGDSAYSAAPNVVRTFMVDAAARQSQTINFGPLPDKRPSDLPFSLSATASSGLAVSFASTTPAVCTVTGNTVTLLAVGQCSILASQAGDSAYSAAPNVVRTFMVDAAARQSQTINFGPLPDKWPSDPPFSLSATASSGLVVSFASTTPAVCTVTGDTVTLLSIGQCSILASQAGDSAYSAAPNVVRTFIVDTAINAQTISFGLFSNKRLSDLPFSLSAMASSGLMVSFASTTPAICVVTGNAVMLLAVGQCSILASQAGSSAYSAAPNVVRTFMVDTAINAQTIDFGLLPDKRPGDPPFSLSATASSGLVVSFTSTTPAVCAVTGNTVTLLSIGRCSILASQAGNSEFGAAADVVRTFLVSNGHVYLPIISR